MKLHALQAAHAEHRETVLALQVRELLFGERAPRVEAAEPLRVACDMREAARAVADREDDLLALRSLYRDDGMHAARLALGVDALDVLTEQTLGRGLRLPFGTYTNWELLDTLEVLAHERYEDLLKKSKVINQEFIDHRTRAVTRRDAEGNEATVLEEAPVSAGDVALASVEDRQREAEEQAKAKQILQNVGKFDVLYLPDLRMLRVESKFSFADITDLSPFKDLGQRLADDPEQELRRTRLDAVIIEGADGMRHTELVPGKTIDKIEAPSTLIPIAQAKKDLADRVLASNVGGARKRARAQLEPIIDTLIEAMGAKAEEILSGYGDRTATRLIQLIGDEQRRHAPKPHYTRVVELREFAPVRNGRPETSFDRTGAFKKVGYEGWTKCYYEQVWFDSSTERDAALILDDADEIAYWVRLHINDLAILWEDGTYNPDFIAVAKDGTHWVVEVKSDRDMKSDEVQAKRKAAQRWANHVSADTKVKAIWRYLLVSEADVKDAKGDWTALRNLAV